MSILLGDCVERMGEMSADSVDAIVCDPPYGLEFMGKEWDRLAVRGTGPKAGFGKSLPLTGSGNPTDRLPAPAYVGGGQTTCRNCGGDRYRKSLMSGGRPRKLCECDTPDFPQVERLRGLAMGEWHQRWATEALRVAKPGAYLLAFGGTRTYHRLACAIEDAGWIIRDCLVWAYAQGFPKSRANLKPAWEPIVMARKPGPLRELAIDACRIGTERDVPASLSKNKLPNLYGDGMVGVDADLNPNVGRWPANVVLVPSAESHDSPWSLGHSASTAVPDQVEPTQDLEDFTRFFLIPKADRSDREPNAYGRLVGGLEEKAAGAYANGIGLPGRTFRDGEWVQTGTWQEPNRKSRSNVHPTVKPVELMRHLVRLVTPPSGTVLDPFLGSGSTAIAAEMEGFAWLGIEREPEYVAIAEARLAGVQRGLGLVS